MRNEGEIILPSCSSADSLAKEVSDFFTRKGAEIRATLDADDSALSQTVVMDAEGVFEEQRLKHLEPSTQDEVPDIIT